MRKLSPESRSFNTSGCLFCGENAYISVAGLTGWNNWLTANFQHFEDDLVRINPILVVHGGAWAIPDDMVEAHLNGVRNAAAAGWRVLERGGPALDAVEESIVVLEDDETFDAGRNRGRTGSRVLSVGSRAIRRESSCPATFR